MNRAARRCCGDTRGRPLKSTDAPKPGKAAIAKRNPAMIHKMTTGNVIALSR
jgi:hypothetical protein